MQRIAFCVLMACQALFLAGCDIEDFGDATRQREDFHYTFALKPGGRLELENFNGSIEITGWDKDTVEINGTKYAPTIDLLNAIKIDIQNTADGVKIKTVRPMERRGNMGAKYIISAPRHVLLDRIESSNGSIRLTDIEGNARLRTSNGSVRANGLKGDLDASTSNGGVELQQFEGGATIRTSNGSIRGDGIRGHLDASTSNGGIDVRVAEIDPDGSLRLESSNGRVSLTMDTFKNNNISVSTSNSSINLRLPTQTAARLKAHTSNGRVTSDFDVTVRGTLSKTRLEGNIGSGGPLIDLSSSNGSIHIEKM